MLVMSIGLLDIILTKLNVMKIFVGMVTFVVGNAIMACGDTFIAIADTRVTPPLFSMVNRFYCEENVSKTVMMKTF